MTQEKEAWSPEEKAADDFQIKAHGKLDEHTTMLAGMVHIGRVVEAATDDATEPGDIPRVLVHIGTNEVGGYVRNWLPWVTARAGYDGEWWRPDIDEQVLVLAPSGNLVQGFIVGSIYRGALTFDSEAGDIKPRDAIPGAAEGAAATEKYIYRRVYRDGSSLSYDPSAHQLAVALKATPKDANSSLAFSAIAPDEKKVKSLYRLVCRPCLSPALSTIQR